MKHPLLLLITLLLLNLPLSAQGKSKLDRLTFTNGEQTEGFVRRNLEFDLGRGVEMRAEGESAFSLHSPRVVESVRLNNGRRFRRVTAMIPSPGEGGRRVEQYRLAEVLMDGDIELLRINLAGNEYEAKALGTENYFYLLRQGDVELPLELTTIVVYQMLHANPSRFRNKLKYFVRDCPVAEEWAREADFTNASILRILNYYADCKGNLTTEVSKRDRPSVVKYNHYARISYMDIRSQGFDDLQFTAGVGYRLEANVLNKYSWLGVLAGLDYVYQTFRYQDAQVVEQSMVKANFSLGVSPVRRENFALQGIIGLSGYNSLESSFRSFFNNNYFMLSSGLRTRINDWQLELSYERMPSAQADRPTNILLFGVEYRLPIR